MQEKRKLLIRCDLDEETIFGCQAEAEAEAELVHMDCKEINQPKC